MGYRFFQAYRAMATAFVVAVGLASCGDSADSGAADIAAQLGGFERQPGFVDIYWDEQDGRLLLGIHQLNEPLLYQSSLARGVGSNDLGFDRGQLGSTKIVEFQRIGQKVLLLQQNLKFRAQSDNADEIRAVRESFSPSVIWGFELATERDGVVVIDATDFLLRDSHGIASQLAENEDAPEGVFAVDASRSAVYRASSKSFPDNAEVEAMVTFVGEATGDILPTVIADNGSFTVNLHHSFIRLPDDNYEPLPYDPRAGIIGLGFGYDGYLDYAAEIGSPLVVAYGRRHRLEKKDPAAEISEAVEPIVYYVDRGAPEPVRSALLEGASWWNAAFEAAGYRDAFQVRLMPEDADPMDVRYNVIQWVHRSTRGWSYGSSIVDPRTGEILKGHVSLGSLRVRQDYMIAEGLLAPYGGGEAPDAMLEMSLARIRQLSAHEVGHTIGMQHNFAASTQGRTSVMDYPFPLLRLGDDGTPDLSDAYDVGMGAWDIRTVIYAYQDYPNDVDADAARARAMAETMASGLRYVSDDDSRAVGTAHPDGNLWDNGADALAELESLLAVRARALEQFSERNIRPGRPLASLEEVLVPIYLLHRYQIRAAGKLIGGERFNYALRGDGQRATDPVAADRQRAAIDAVIATLAPGLLRLPEDLLDQIPARPPGFSLTRESFARRTGKTFDPIAPARSAASLTLDVLLDHERAARMIAAHARQAELPGFDELVSSLMASTWYAGKRNGVEAEIQRASGSQVLLRLMLLANNAEADTQVRAIALDAVNGLASWLAARAARETDPGWRAHYGLAGFHIERMRQDPASIELLQPVAAPPGSPI